MTNDLPFELFIAVRYLLARRKQAFISLISLISTLGVMVGVMALLIALALMTGLQGELRDRILGSTAHVYVFKSTGTTADYDSEVARLRQLPHVVGAAPVVNGPAMIVGGGGEYPITVKGIIPRLEPSVTRVSESMQTGSLAALEPKPGEMPGVLIGHELARRLGSFLGDTVELITPHGPITPFGASPGFRRLKVVGVYNLGLLEFDQAYAFVHLDVAERLLDKQRPFFELRVDDLFRAQSVADSIPDALGTEYMAQDWADMNQSLFSALSLEKLAISVTIGLIVMVAALNIIASLILLVMEKSRDIAILKTMGSSSASIRRIFMFQGLVIGLIGTLGGAIFGSLTIYFADKYKLVRVPIDVYQISYVPFRLEMLDFLIVVIAAILICFLATIYPSRQAAKLDPAQALRYQ